MKAAGRERERDSRDILETGKTGLIVEVCILPFPLAACVLSFLLYIACRARDTKSAKI